MTETTFAAFLSTQLMARGPLEQVLTTVHSLGYGTAKQCLFFDESTGIQIDFDLRGSLEEIKARLAKHPGLSANEAQPRGPGRPKLGVSCKEVCLLPAQWDWLASQSGGPSAALRRLVMAAMKAEPQWGLDPKRKTATDKVLVALAGNQPRYEEASRALWADDLPTFEAIVTGWPDEIGAWAMEQLTGRNTCSL